jgi:hypothetical protein
MASTTLSTGPVKYLSITATGTANIVAALTGKRIRILTMALSAGAAGATWQFNTGGGDAITGVHVLAANGVFTVNSSGLGLGETSTGGALELAVTSGALNGSITYQEVIMSSADLA